MHKFIVLENQILIRQIARMVLKKVDKVSQERGDICGILKCLGQI